MLYLDTFLNISKNFQIVQFERSNFLKCTIADNLTGERLFEIRERLFEIEEQLFQSGKHLFQIVKWLFEIEEHFFLKNSSPISNNCFPITNCPVLNDLTSVEICPRKTAKSRFQIHTGSNKCLWI